MKINYYRALLAGVIGTVLFDIVGLLFTGTWWDIPGVLAQAIGLPFPIALVMHYGNGVALAAIYAALAPSLFGPSWFRALVFTTLETVMLVWFLLFPLLDLGIAGLAGGAIFPILSMVRHWAYAVPLFYFFPVEAASAESDGDVATDDAFTGGSTGDEECETKPSFAAFNPTNWSPGSFVNRT